jgi:hypothetical protein
MTHEYSSGQCFFASRRQQSSWVFFIGTACSTHFPLLLIIEILIDSFERVVVIHDFRDGGDDEDIFWHHEL